MQRIDTQQALSSAGAMGEAMHEHRRRVEVRVATACVAPLVDAVLCADLSKVDVEEYQRASLLLGSLCWMDLDVTAEFMRDGRYTAAWRASGNAVNAVVAKDPAELTRDDAMTLICDNASTTVQWCQGFTNVCERAGLDIAGDWIAGWNTHHGLLPTRTPSDEMNQRVAVMYLDVCRDQAASPEVVASAMLGQCWLVMARPAICITLVEAGLLDVGMALLRQHSPVEWVNWRCGKMVMLSRFVALWTVSLIQKESLLQRLGSNVRSFLLQWALSSSRSCQASTKRSYSSTAGWWTPLRRCLRYAAVARLRMHEAPLIMPRRGPGVRVARGQQGARSLRQRHIHLPVDASLP